MTECIQHTHAAKSGESWCGRKLADGDWRFQSIDHAAYAIQNNGSVMPCVACVAAIRNLFSDGSGAK